MMQSLFARLSAGLVIRANEVELMAIHGSRAVAHVRVPVAGSRGDDLSQAIRQALAISGVKTRRLAVALPTDDVLIRFFLMPPLPKAERDTAVQFEARKYIPFKTEELVWDYYVGESRQTSQLEVTFAAVQRSVFDQLQAVLTEAGVQPERIEPRSLSLARLAAAPREPALDADAYACLVDVDEGRAHLVIARGGVPFLTRDVVFQAAAGGETKDPIDPRAQRLCSELRVSIDFFTREHPSANVSHVILVGNEGFIGPWQSWLAEQLDCIVGLGTDLVRARVAGALPLAFAAAVGLVMPVDERGGVGLDFLKRSAAKATVADQPAKRPAASQLVQEMRTPWNLAIVGGVVGLLVALWIAGSQRMAKEEQRLANLVRARPVVGWGLEAMDQANVELIREKAAQQLELLKRLVDGRVGVVAKLDALARSLSEGMWLTEIAFEEKPDAMGKSQVTMKVQGACFLDQVGKELSAIQAFEARVKKNPSLFRGFQGASVEQIREQVKEEDEAQYTYRTFQLHCRSDRKM